MLYLFWKETSHSFSYILSSTKQCGYPLTLRSCLGSKPPIYAGNHRGKSKLTLALMNDDRARHLRQHRTVTAKHMWKYVFFGKGRVCFSRKEYGREKDEGSLGGKKIKNNGKGVYK